LKRVEIALQQQLQEQLISGGTYEHFTTYWLACGPGAEFEDLAADMWLFESDDLFPISWRH
jgi:hypothetical protein